MGCNCSNWCLGYRRHCCYFGNVYFIRGIKKSYDLTLVEENAEIIKEGKLAFANNLKNENNPYGSDEHELRDAWDKGWKSGERAREALINS